MSEQVAWWPDLMAIGPVAGSGLPMESENGAESHVLRARQLADRIDGTTVFSLSRPEQLLLWSARRWRHGRFRWDQVEAEFKRLLPGGWADAMLSWEDALEQLHQYPSSRPEIGNGCITTLSRDERALLTLVAGLQRPRLVVGDLLLARLATPGMRAELVATLRAVATSFAMGSLCLPLRGPAPALHPGQSLPLLRLVK
ncbi:hypothetical protein [Niveispirillum sp. BGYR6]|uniref:hypothetical protein n=1 Tax=Niveispirillum sp. BGYR6 TaxID=2971249 RepID=UPI0022B99070|nr:hypothetical protein [Niveispirillum sp. BGYR6]MDG5495783.1 hypothetical protein [Niveispirillum sp. BGYR6]